VFFKKRRQQKQFEPADWLIVGLGNPGMKYAQTRHNVGFLAVDVLAEELGGSYWKEQGGAQTCVVKVSRPGNDPLEVVLAKPQTFMNLSGSAVKNLCEAYSVDPEQNLIVIADELDIPAGEVREKRGGGHAGHNGHRSIIDSLGTRDYSRIRVGVGRPPGRMDPADYVLQMLKPQAFEELLISAADAAHLAKEHIKLT